MPTSERTSALARDPSMTAGLRRSFVADMKRRFTSAFRGLAARVVLALGRPRFAFRQDDEKLEAFQDWFRQQVKDKILIVDDAMKETPWLATYVRSAYREAIVRAHAAVRRGQSLPFTDLSAEEFLIQSFAAPEQVSKVRMMASRTFTDLKNVTAEMDARMTRILTDGIAHGRPPVKVARELNREVIGLGRMRSELIARNEIIRVHAEGQLDAFEALGVEEVGLEVELLTAWNACPICKDIAAGGPYSIAEARGIIPVHVRCRCAWRPLVNANLRSIGRNRL